MLVKQANAEITNWLLCQCLCYSMFSHLWSSHQTGWPSIILLLHGHAGIYDTYRHEMQLPRGPKNHYCFLQKTQKPTQHKCQSTEASIITSQHTSNCLIHQTFLISLTSLFLAEPGLSKQLQEKMPVQRASTYQVFFNSCRGQTSLCLGIAGLSGRKPGKR